MPKTVYADTLLVAQQQQQQHENEEEQAAGVPKPASHTQTHAHASLRNVARGIPLVQATHSKHIGKKRRKEGDVFDEGDKWWSSDYDS